MLRLRTLASLIALMAAVACGSPQVSLREGPREHVGSDYESVRDLWTRTENMLSFAELDNLLSATATFESWDFRWAYVVRYAVDYRLTLDQRAKLLEKALAETRESHHFFVAITGGNRKFNDLTRPNSAWIVRLIDSTGTETAPEEIVSIKRPNALERTYYPYTTVFHSAFRVKFPRTSADGRPTISPKAEWFGIRFAGAQGNVELRWDVEQDLPSGAPRVIRTPASAPAPDASAAPTGAAPTPAPPGSAAPSATPTEPKPAESKPGPTN